MEDSAMKHDKHSRKKSKVNQVGDRTNMGERENKELEEDSLGTKICKELEIEEFERTEEYICSTAQGLGIFQQEIGIEINQDGLTSPKYDKPKGKWVGDL